MSFIQSITHPGQPYYHEPIYAYPAINILRASISRAFGSPVPEPKLIGYERVNLVWMKPGPDGKLIQK